MAAAIGLALGTGACERHSWDSTKRLFPPPEGVETAADTENDAGASATDDEPADSDERDASLLPQ